MSASTTLPYQDAFPYLSIANLKSVISAADLDDLLRHMQARTFAKGEFIFRAGQPGQEIYLLRRGRVKLYRVSESGREVIMRMGAPGELFGLIDVLRGARRVITAEACGACEVHAMTREQFRAYLQGHGEFALQIMRLLAWHIHTLGELVESLAADDVNTRLLKLLRWLSQHYGVRNGEETYIALPLTHQEIASMVGATRQTVTRTFVDLKRRGLVRYQGRHLLVGNAL